MTIKQFSNQYFEWKKSTSEFPYPKRDRFTDSTEKGLVLMIKAHCKMNGWQCTTYDARGHQNKDGKWMMSKLDKGRGDCFVIIPVIGITIAENGELGTREEFMSRFVWIEIKIGRDYQKPHQKKFQEDCMRLGIGYIMPKTWHDYYTMIQGKVLA